MTNIDTNDKAIKATAPTNNIKNGKTNCTKTPNTENNNNEDIITPMVIKMLNILGIICLPNNPNAINSTAVDINNPIEMFNKIRPIIILVGLIAFKLHCNNIKTEESNNIETMIGT
jgi:hypothetical protein